MQSKFTDMFPLIREAVRFPSVRLSLLGIVLTTLPAVWLQRNLAEDLVDMARAREVARVERMVAALRSELRRGEVSVTRLAALVGSVAGPGEGESLRRDLETRPDGVLRLRQVDATREAAVWFPASALLTDETADLVQHARAVVGVFGQGALGAPLVNSWFLPLAGGEVVFFPTDPGFVDAVTPTLDYRNTPWVQLANPAANPEGRPRWTPLNYDPAAQAWMVSVVAPVRVADRWVGSVGHDILLGSLLTSMSVLAADSSDARIVWVADRAGRLVDAGTSNDRKRGPLLPPADRRKVVEVLSTGGAGAGEAIAERRGDRDFVYGAIPELGVVLAYQIDEASIWAQVQGHVLATQLAQAAMLLALALGIGASMLQGTRHRAQRQLLLERANADLASRVEERTAALQGANLRLRSLSEQDPLTQMANRRGLAAYVGAHAESWRQAGRLVSVAMFDVDFFKKYNDTYGHGAGDDCLVCVAGVLQRAVGPGDLAARLGGEEFVLVLPGRTAVEAGEVASQAQRLLAERKVRHGASPSGFVTVSCGVAAGTPDDDHAPLGRLMARADEALYRAKLDGRDRVVVSESSGEGATPEAGPTPD